MAELNETLRTNPRNQAIKIFDLKSLLRGLQLNLHNLYPFTVHKFTRSFGIRSITKLSEVSVPLNIKLARSTSSCPDFFRVSKRLLYKSDFIYFDLFEPTLRYESMKLNILTNAKRITNPTSKTMESKINTFSCH